MKVDFAKAAITTQSDRDRRDRNFDWLRAVPSEFPRYLYLTSMAISKRNSDIIHVLTKMGIYLERDKVNLSKLSPSDQNERIQKAFDCAVENCCILPLLFEKSELAPGKLVLSDRPEWEGWRQSQLSKLSKLSPSSAPGNILNMKAFVDAIGRCIYVIHG